MISKTATVRLLNVDFDDITMEELLCRKEGRVITVHVFSLAKLQRDREFYELIRHFDVVTCDSQILYWAARILGTPLRERVSGSDYFPLFYARYADDPSVTIYLLGAMGDIAVRAQEEINRKVGREMVVGTHSPQPGWLEDAEYVDGVIKDVDESEATVLVVGLNAGEQERFIIEHGARLAYARLLLPLGGTIDYEAGAVVRPPPFVTKVGLEWAWRLLREPRRRWRRYLLVQPPVIWQLLRQRFGWYRDPFAQA